MNRFFLASSALAIAAALLLTAGFVSSAHASAPGSSQGWLGVVLGDADSRDGVVVDTILRKSPAHEAGLQEGIRIFAIDHREVRTPGKLQSILRRQPPGAQIVVEYGDGDDRESQQIRLAASPSSSEVLQLHHQGFDAPDLELPKLHGDDTADLSSGVKRPLVIEFWATWCSVCRQVSRKLEAALQDAPEAFDVISVTREDASTVREHLKTQPKAHDIALDDREAGHDTYLVTSYPFVAVIDTDGTIQSVVTDLDGVEPVIEELVDDHQ